MAGTNDEPNLSSAFRRFSKRLTVNADGCHVWHGAGTQQGYGQFRNEHGHHEMTHRFAWRMAHGSIPYDMFVLHRCDNPPCCNPAHLWLGTKQDNASDKMANGRHRCAPPVGAKHYRAKLDDIAVLAIYASQEPQAVLATRYGVVGSTIGKIRRAECWRSVLDPSGVINGC